MPVEKARNFRTKRDGICPFCSGPVPCGEEVFPVERPGESLASSNRFAWAHMDCAREAGGGVLKPPKCKHWGRLGKCMFESSCFFEHPMELGQRIRDERAARLVEEQRHKTTHTKSMKKQNRGVGKRNKVRNDSRAGVFRRWLLDSFGRELLASGSGVLDIAGGKGELAFELLNLNNIETTVVDPRPLDIDGFTRKLNFGMYHRNKILGKHVDRTLVSSNTPW
jgi:hypothetical protein